MEKIGTIHRVFPEYVIPGGEITIEGTDFGTSLNDRVWVLANETPCRIVSASSIRIIAIIPDEVDEGRIRISLESGWGRSEGFPITIGRRLIANIHQVANPAVDPHDDSLIFTRSGSRGQALEETIFRLNTDGIAESLPDPIMNPTGIAFGMDGKMYVTNRSDGDVYSIDQDGFSTLYAGRLGIATGIAFDKEGIMYVGDRSGTIYRVFDIADFEVFAKLEPSVAAYHLTFGPDERLYVSAPGLSSSDAVYSIDKTGNVEIFFRGLGRPQGSAFSSDGSFFIAASYAGRRGVIRIKDGKAENFAAGNGIVGICFTRNGEMIAATNNSLYSIACDLKGILL